MEEACLSLFRLSYSRIPLLFFPTPFLPPPPCEYLHPPFSILPRPPPPPPPPPPLLFFCARAVICYWRQAREEGASFLPPLQQRQGGVKETSTTPNWKKEGGEA